MSTLYFHNLAGTTEVRGSERHYAAGFVSDLAWGALSWYPYEREGSYDALRKLFVPAFAKDIGSIRPEAVRESVRLSLSVSSDKPVFQVEGKVLNSWSLELNTALVVGNDVVKFLARLHGQVEIHAWIAGCKMDADAHPFFANLLQQGLDTHLLRPDAGWEDVIAAFHGNPQEATVLSTSVCESFPNRGMAREGGFEIDPENEDAYHELPHEKQWEYAFKGLQNCQDKKFLQLDHHKWQEFRFGHKRDYLWLRAQADKIKEG